MSELEPECEKLMAHYRANMAEYSRMMDTLSYPRFSKNCLDELTRMIGNDEAPELIQAVVRLRVETDKTRIKEEQKAVKKLLFSTYGKRLPRGKRPHPVMVNLVRTIAPILLYYGLPLRTSATSSLVLALTFIAEEIGLEGDPRDELRRLARLKAKLSRQIRAHFYGVLADAIRPSPRVATDATK